MEGAFLSISCSKYLKYKFLKLFYTVLFRICLEKETPKKQSFHSSSTTKEFIHCTIYSCKNIQVLRKVYQNSAFYFMSHSD
jgi:hypothetical protein